MRDVIRPQLELGQVAIEEIDLNENSRNNIPLRGIQHVYADPSTRLSEILEEGILPGVSHTKGRPGAVEDPGVLKQGPRYDFDHLHELVNKTVRKSLGHISDDTRYEHQTAVDNVSQLTPNVLRKVSQLVAESGHAMVRSKDCPRAGRSQRDRPVA